MTNVGRCRSTVRVAPSITMPSAPSTSIFTADTRPEGEVVEGHRRHDRATARPGGARSVGQEATVGADVGSETHVAAARASRDGHQLDVGDAVRLDRVSDQPGVLGIGLDRHDAAGGATGADARNVW